MLQELLPALVIPAIGLATGGIVTSAHMALEGSGGGFRADFSTWRASVWSILLSAFGGPQIVFVSAWKAWRRSGISLGALALAGMLSLVWSTCAGIVIVEALAAAGLVGAA